MRHTMHQDRVKARVAEHNFKNALRRRIFTKYGVNLLPDNSKHMLLSDLFRLGG
jgi:hypothetical protein